VFFQGVKHRYGRTAAGQRQLARINVRFFRGRLYQRIDIDCGRVFGDGPGVSRPDSSRRLRHAARVEMTIYVWKAKQIHRTENSRAALTSGKLIGAVLTPASVFCPLFPWH
jgi:hypothetical protein